MANETTSRISLPLASWDQLKRMIRAYHAAQDEENPTVDAVAKLAGMMRPQISSNNNFLRSAGFVQDGANKLTMLGSRYATGLSFNNEPLSVSSLQEILRGQEGFLHLINILKARGSMPIEALKGEAIILAGLNEKGKNQLYFKTILDMLQESQLVHVSEDSVAYRSNGTGNSFFDGSNQNTETVIVAKKDAPKNIPSTSTTAIPIPLGVGRLVYVELPTDWTSKDLPKLLKMLELSLGDGE